MRAPGVQVVPSRVVALPTDGVVWEWDFHGKRTISEEGSELAAKNLDDSINYRLSLQGGYAVTSDTLAGWPWAAPFHGWSVRMMNEIMAERLGHSSVTHESVAEWRYRGALASWREKLAADFVLVSMFLDGRNTPGRAFAVAFAGGSLAARRAMACVVRMEDGRVVWCNLITINSLLAERGGAQAVADSLLRDLLGKRPAAGAPAPRANAVGQAARPPSTPTGAE